MVDEKLMWNINEKEIYDKATFKNSKLEYYCNYLHMFYNNYINLVDVSDQLGNSYNFSTR